MCASIYIYAWNNNAKETMTEREQESYMGGFGDRKGKLYLRCNYYLKN